MYFSCTFTSILRRKEAILTQSSLLCESLDKFSTKCKFLASNNDAILSYWPLNNTFFTFYILGSAIFKLLSCLEQIFLISYKKHLNDKFKKMNWKHQNHSCFLFPPKE